MTLLNLIVPLCLFLNGLAAAAEGPTQRDLDLKQKADCLAGFRKQFPVGIYKGTIPEGQNKGDVYQIQIGSPQDYEGIEINISDKNELLRSLDIMDGDTFREYDKVYETVSCTLQSEGSSAVLKQEVNNHGTISFQQLVFKRNSKRQVFEVDQSESDGAGKGFVCHLYQTIPLKQ
jgi:hypothetical protein